MRKVLLRHQLVGFYGRLNIVFMYPQGHTHQHVLRAFCYFTVDSQQVRTFQSFKPKIVVAKVSIVNDS